MPDEIDAPLDLAGIEPPLDDVAPTLPPFAEAIAAAEATPPNIPRYRIIRLIGIGGMGAVWEAEQEQPRRTVAMKVIRPGRLTPPVLRRFEHEVEMLGRLRHPGIAQIFDAGAISTPSGRQPYFAMEYVRGARLDEYIRAVRPTVAQRLELLSRICDAVQHAHQQGVIHRDLKPANILVDESGQPKILDFGVARATDADLQATQHTDPGQFVGTLHYMSPEQAAGHAHLLDTRSDVYALGVIAFELLADRPLYELDGKPVDEALRMIRHDPHPSLSGIDRALRGDVETIVGKALEKEKERRYASVGELSADIRRFLNYEPITARPPSGWYQLSRFARRNKVLVGGALAVILALTAGMIATSVQVLRARRAERDAQAQQALAQRRFDDVRSLTNKFMFEFHARIQSLPGATPALKLLADTSLEYLGKLAADANGDPKLLLEVATAYDRVSVTQAATNDVAGALNSRLRSREIVAQLMEARPNDFALQRRMAILDMSIGDAAFDLGDSQTAMRRHQQALASFQRLTELQPQNTTARRDLWFIHGQLGDTLAAAGDLHGALDHHRVAMEMMQRLASPERDSRQAQQDLAASHFRLGRTMTQIGKNAEAIGHYTTSLEMYQRLAESEPLNVYAQKKLASTHMELGDVLAATGDAAGALANYRQNLDIFRRLGEADPENALTQDELSLSQARIGNALRASGDIDGAMEQYRASLQTSQRLSERDPNNSRALRQIAACHSKMGDIAFERKNWTAAIDHARRALEVSQPLLNRDPRNTATRLDIAISHSQLGDAYAAMGAATGAPPPQRLTSWRDARAEYTASLQEFRQLQDSRRLAPAYATIPQQISRQLESCDAAIAGLQSSEAATSQP